MTVADADEIDVEATEPGWFDEEIELRIRGPRHALVAVIGVLNVGTARMRLSKGDDIVSRTRRGMAQFSCGLVEQLGEEPGWSSEDILAKRDEVPEFYRGRAKDARRAIGVEAIDPDGLEEADRG